MRRRHVRDSNSRLELLTICKKDNAVQNSLIYGSLSQLEQTSSRLCAVFLKTNVRTRISGSSFSLIRRCAGILLLWATSLGRNDRIFREFSRTGRGPRVTRHTTRGHRYQEPVTGFTNTALSYMLATFTATNLFRARLFPEPKESVLCEIVASYTAIQSLLITPFSRLDTRSPCASRSTFCYYFR